MPEPVAGTEVEIGSDLFSAAFEEAVGGLGENTPPADAEETPEEVDEAPAEEEAAPAEEEKLEPTPVAPAP